MARQSNVRMETEAAMKSVLECLVSAETLEAHPHLGDTPRRATDWLLQYSQPKGKFEDVIKQGFDEQYDGMVVQKDIEFSALCAHHLLPFSGKAAVGYWPDQKVLGLSKLARSVEYFSERVTLQEHITEQTAKALFDATEPWYVGVFLYDVQHGCMTVRGVKQPCAVTNTFVAYKRTDSIQAATGEETFWRMFGSRA